jgi:prepilin-type N-terminal cleavage/methylation domain-containing protein
MNYDKLLRSFYAPRAFTLIELLVVLVIIGGMVVVARYFIGCEGFTVTTKNEQTGTSTITVITNPQPTPNSPAKNWTPESIEEDPKGYSQYVEAKLKADLDKFTTVNRELQLRMETLAELESRKAKLIAKGEPLKEQFAQAITDGKFPAVVQNKEYTESQLRMQLALILAQLEGYEETLAEIKKGSETAQAEIERNVLAIDKTETEIALLATRRAVWESKATSTEGRKLIEKVNAILEGNEVVLKDNPVRSIDVIIAQAEKSEAAKQPRDVDKYLQEFKSKNNEK